jgi:hypothetical protein
MPSRQSHTRSSSGLLHEAMLDDVDAGLASKIQRRRFSSHDVTVVVVVRELRDQLAAVIIENCRLRSCSAERSRSGSEECSHCLMVIVYRFSRGRIWHAKQLR